MAGYLRGQRFRDITLWECLGPFKHICRAPLYSIFALPIFRLGLPQIGVTRCAMSDNGSHALA